MDKTRVGINGFGRIGRQVLKVLLEDYSDTISVVAINDIADKKVGRHLFKYDSIYGVYDAAVVETDAGMRIEYTDIDPADTEQFDIAFMNEFKVENIDWAKHGVSVVIESTGKFTSKSDAEKHITAGGAKKVIISAPAKGEDLTVVLGVNGGDYLPDVHNVISNASCTTNCVAPMVKVLHNVFGVESAFMTTIHAYTSDQRVQDIAHSDLRRARAAAQNIIPTTTGAARAVTTVIPELTGRIDGMAFRVPVTTGSVTDLVVKLSKSASIDAINATYRDAAENELANVLDYSDEPLTSSDYIGNPHSCTIDGLSTSILGGDFVKVVGWYDNEYGYSCRVADLTAMVSKDLSD